MESPSVNPPKWASLPDRPRAWKLVLGDGKSWSLNEKCCYVLGRNSCSDIPLNSKNVSRSHACIANTADGRLYVTDLGSVHGE